MTISPAKIHSLRPNLNRTLAQKYSTIGTNPATQPSSVLGSLPNLLAWLRHLGLSDSQILSIDEWSAAWNECIWATHGYLGMLGFQANKPNNSRVSFDCEDWDGQIKLRMQLLATMGEYSFAGPSQWTDQYGWTPGTRLEIDSVWIGVPNWEKSCISTSNQGLGKEGEYVQGLSVSRLTCIGYGGLGAHDYNTASHGIYVENGGSTAQLDRVVCDGFNGSGIRIKGAIPLKLNHVRTFRNNLAGVQLLDGAEATVFGEIEGDDNAHLFWAPDGVGLADLVIKSEQGKKGVREGGQTILRLGGQHKVSAKIKSAVYAGMPDCLVRIDSQHVNSYLRVPLLSDETGSGTSAGFRHLLRTPFAVHRMPAAAEGCGFVFKAGTLYSDMR